MFKKNLAMTILGLFTHQYAAPAIAANITDMETPKHKIKQGKGQLRDVKPKPSGAAQLKRASKKRANIRKHN